MTKVILTYSKVFSEDLFLHKFIKCVATVSNFFYNYISQNLIQNLHYQHKKVQVY